MDLSAIIRARSAPLAPSPTGTRPRIVPCAGLGAVLFDVYGTLLVSGSGDVGTLPASSRAVAFRQALDACGLLFAGADALGIEAFVAAIEASHAASRRQGIAHPEVDILEVWAATLEALHVEPRPCDRAPRTDCLRRLAVEYEVRANPTWPMPDLVPTLESLARRGLRLGVVSNAQFFTPLALEAHTGRTLQQLGFDESLLVFSHRHGHAKPGDALFAVAVKALARLGVAPHAALFVGNDMRNDVAPARRAGLRTALFAGDARSLRMRQEDSTCRGLVPDLVVTELAQLLDAIP